MKTKIKILLIISFINITNSCIKEKSLFVSYRNSEITYSGRIDTTKINAAELHWSGSSIKLSFEGEAISALLQDNNGDNYYNVFIDDSLFIIRPDTIKKLHKLAENLGNGKHTLEIFKRTEWDRGKTSFFGFRINGKPKILKNEPLPKRKIEFYGNSITAGYGNEDLSGKDSPDSIFTNNYNSYAAITARHYNADYSCICKGGIGIMVSWFPFTMPEIYNRLAPDDPASEWDFSLFQPDIVVVNLFQNDSWLVNLHEHEEFKRVFNNTPPSDEYIISSYKKFIRNLRSHYPNTNIICALGNMDATKEGSKWPGYIESAVSSLNDNKIFTHFFPYKNTPCHPSVSEHNDMAKSLINFIDKNIKW